MEKHIKEKFNDTILAQARDLYIIKPDEIKLLDGFESFIYEFNRGEEEFILRIAHSSRRCENLINGEVDFINYLAANGVSASGAIPSQNGKLVESISDEHGGTFLTTAFTKAPGTHFKESNWNAEHWITYGQEIGRMHALAQNYQVSKPAWKRPHWDHQDNLDIAGWLPAGEDKVIEKFNTLMAHLVTLPKDKDVYGMIHQDAHRGNLFVDQNGKITFFDFDDCCLGWYTYDLAMVLFYVVPVSGDRDGFARSFLTEFLRGYRQEFEIDAFWLSQIPYFLKLREIDLYAVIHRSFDVSNLDDDPWVATYMDGRREKIEKGIPFLDLDFSQLG